MLAGCIWQYGAVGGLQACTHTQALAGRIGIGSHRLHLGQHAVGQTHVQTGVQFAAQAQGGRKEKVQLPGLGQHKRRLQRRHRLTGDDLASHHLARDGGQQLVLARRTSGHWPQTRQRALGLLQRAVCRCRAGLRLFMARCGDDAFCQQRCIALGLQTGGGRFGARAGQFGLCAQHLLALNACQCLALAHQGTFIDQ